MDDIEHVHECVGCWTDDGVWQVSPDDPIVRCKDCAHMSKYQLVGGGCYRTYYCTYFGFPIPDQDGFCAWGKTEEDER